MKPDLTNANQRITRYLCGTCGDESTATWATHQAHYEGHKS